VILLHKFSSSQYNLERRFLHIDYSPHVHKVSVSLDFWKKNKQNNTKSLFLNDLLVEILVGLPVRFSENERVPDSAKRSKNSYYQNSDTAMQYFN
jgi:hypothetical protein